MFLTSMEPIAAQLKYLGPMMGTRSQLFRHKNPHKMHFTVTLGL